MAGRRLAVALLVGAGLRLATAGAEADPMGGLRQQAVAVAGPNAAGAGWFLVSLVEKADLSAAYGLSTKAARGQLVFEQLRAVAERTQPPLVAWLESRGAVVERFWIDNLLRVRADSGTLALLAAHHEVDWVRPEGRIRLIEPVEEAAPLEGGKGHGAGNVQRGGRQPTGLDEPEARLAVVESGIKEINADDVWKMGFTGQGVVVVVTDTGVDLRHPALKKNYRGYPKMEHDYNWLDAVKDAEDPLDVSDHGTHVTGTIVGSDPIRQVGVAPGAHFISCRLIESRSGVDGASLRCLQWAVAPTNRAGESPRPDLAPDILNASWGNEPGNSCLVETLRNAVRAIEAAGILFVASAGNSGDKCKSICVPGAFPEVFTVANYDVRGREISATSSRGVVEWPSGSLIKPDIAAPGTGINSSVPPTRYDKKSGTSMAAPHVAGAAALLLSARPELKGKPEVLRAVMERTAKRGRPTNRCGPADEGTGKDNVEGMGVVDVKAAVELALTATPPPPPSATPTRTPRPTMTPTHTPAPATDTPAATEEPVVEPTPLSASFRVFAPYTARRWAFGRE